MLHFFARRMKEARDKDESGQGGFTLIELLVVVIIIGILAAIAIPTFLSQRSKSQDAAAKSDLRNMAAAATSYSADNNGLYTGMTKAKLKSDYDFNETKSGTNPGPTVSEVAVATDNKSWSATSLSESTKNYKYDSNEGVVTEVVAP